MQIVPVVEIAESVKQDLIKAIGRLTVKRSTTVQIGTNHEVIPVAKTTFNRMWSEEDGVLSFEWVLLLTLLVIGIVSGVAGARDAIIDELGDVAQAMLALDQSYQIDFPLEVVVHAPTTSSASDSTFTDAFAFEDCDRTNSPLGQGVVVDADARES